MKSLQVNDVSIEDALQLLDKCKYSLILANIKELPLTGSYEITIDDGLPHKISNLIYTNYAFDWILMLCNGLKSTEFTKGRTILYPEVKDLTDFLVKYSK